MDIAWNKDVNALCADYINGLAGGLEKAKLSDNVKDLVKKFLDCIDIEKRNYNEFLRSLTNEVYSSGLTDIKDLFTGKLRGFATYLLGEEWTDLLNRYMFLESLSSYTREYSRRSQRYKSPLFHIDEQLIHFLESFITLRASGLATKDILSRCNGMNELPIDIEPWLAAKIDAGDKECMDYLRDAMTSENNSRILTYSHFRAIAKSGNDELLELEGKLLLAARLQEGLRQAIVETMDEGQTKSFIHMLKVIRENNLQRFSSVKRSFAVITGFGDGNPSERVTDKFLDLIYEYVTDIRMAYKALESDDAMKIYLALWAIGFYDIGELKEPILDLVKNAPSYKVCAALLMLDCTRSISLYREISKAAIRLRTDDHRILAGALPYYFPEEFTVSNSDSSQRDYDVHIAFDSEEEAESDFRLLSKLHELLSTKEKFNSYVFPWMEATLSRSTVASKLCEIAILLGKDEYVDKALDYIVEIPADSRSYYLKALVAYPHTVRQIEYVVMEMADKSRETSEEACKIVEEMHGEKKLSAMEYYVMENHLRLKNPYMRRTIIRIFGSLPDLEAMSTVTALLMDSSHEKRLAGLDIIRNWQKNKERSELVEWIMLEKASFDNISPEEKILIDSIYANVKSGSAKDNDIHDYDRSNGFGLYDPEREFPVIISKPAESDLRRYVVFENPEESGKIVGKLIELINENSDLEFKIESGYVVRLGNSVLVDHISQGLKALAYPEIWKEFYEKEIRTPLNMFRLYFSKIRYNREDEPFYNSIKKILGKEFVPNPVNVTDNTTLLRSIDNVARKLFEEYCNCSEILEISCDILTEYALKSTPDDCSKEIKTIYYNPGERLAHRIFQKYPIGLLVSLLKNNWETTSEELFRRSFMARYELYRKSGYLFSDNALYSFPFDPMEFLHAVKTGLITDKDLWKEMLSRHDNGLLVQYLTRRYPGADLGFQTRKNERELDENECRIVGTAIDRILDIELKRGDTETPVSTLARSISAVKGLDYFIRILVALGKERPKYDWYFEKYDKKEVLSHLLKVSYPDNDSTPEALRIMAEEHGISETKLIEAAMFSPRWLGIVEKTIGWEGLTSAVYYFLAHTGEYLNANEKSHVERYSSIPPEDFADGAFDPIWFREVYDTLGEKKFQTVYKAARLITSGNRHTRSRKLSDAALGKLNPVKVMDEIKEKRNKDLVVALGLIPLTGDKGGDIRSRYSFLQDFLKESRQFGAQRKASEGRAVKLALDNLARTAGYGDSTRLTWSIEADLIDEFRQYLTPCEVKGYMMYVNISDGIPEIIVEKDGKRQKSIPSALKKNESVLKLKEIAGIIKEQYVRGRRLLEKAMVDSSGFSGAEIRSLKDNPVIWKLLSGLVLVTEDSRFGFPGDDGESIISYDGAIHAVKEDEMLRIAHPYDLFNAGVWSGYQDYLFSRKLRQPFRQIFRELYVPTDEEKNCARSLRFAGNQILPTRAVAMLRGRDWTVDYENGLQKICYESDVIAVMYAMADWFTPADIEAPTLEYVAFYNRRDGKEMKMSDIPPTVFSEIMRDVDLAVSVAHAGGVDPETSHSTMEMRAAIINHTLPMLGIKNASVCGHFIKIKGKLNDYNIHLGSGVIHKEGGIQIAVVPVHSQSRGRVFLPFIDEDPKTAEIISKMILFSDDAKIKDPSILSQIHS